jgi:hypothetical protein
LLIKCCKVFEQIHFFRSKIMKIFNTIYKFLVILALTNVSCRREPRPKEEQHMGPFYFDKYADYFWFRPGTYWIYENNRTGELDTCTLLTMKRDTVTQFYEHSQFKRWYTYERIDYSIFTNHRFGVVNYNTVTGCLDCPQMDSLRAIKRNSSRNVFYLPWNSEPGYSAYYPSMQVDGKTFNDVYRIDLLSDGGLPFWDDTKLLWGGQNGSAKFSSYYWAKDVGLIQIKYKKTLSTGLDSAYWNLKTFNILKF